MSKKITRNIIILVLIVLFVGTIFAAVEASAAGNKLVALENKYDELTQENQEMQDKLVGSTSLTSIAKEASSSGMISPEAYVYITNSGIALR
ncbi:MAG TPA: hypothetical protein VG895_02770 [Patescibacteria group bacterium]|nr:hypothetical protein [Patescibacteria group bacterium]